MTGALNADARLSFPQKIKTFSSVTDTAVYLWYMPVFSELK